MDPTNPLGYISGFPAASPTFSAGWTSNRPPSFGNWYDQSNLMPTPPNPQTQQPANTQPQSMPQSAADNAASSSPWANLFGSGSPNLMSYLGLAGLLGGIPLSQQQMNSMGVNSLLSGGQQGQQQNKSPNPLSLAQTGMRMMSGGQGGATVLDPNTGRLVNSVTGAPVNPAQMTSPFGMFGSLAGR